MEETTTQKKGKRTTYALKLEIPRLNLQSETVEIKGGYFLPLIKFEPENQSEDLKVNKSKPDKMLQVYSHYRRESINYDITFIDTKPSVGEISLNCSIEEAIECAIQHGTIYFKLETTEGLEDNLMFSDSTQSSYEGEIGSRFNISLMIPEDSAGGSTHRLIAYIKEGSNEIQVGRIDIRIKQVGAWVVKRNWNAGDLDGYSKFVVTKIKEYIAADKRFDCADLALSLLIDYASKEGLPVKLKTKTGKSYKSYSEKYNNIEGYKKDIFPNINAIDISSNTFTVDKKTEARVGDMIILKEPFGHIVIYSQIEEQRKLSYGNLGTENGVAVIPPIVTKNDWSNSTKGGLKYDPDITKAHRWIFLK